ncbi:MAG: XrtA system polysaccharide deacetylase [Planctomycetota bacterium]|jgi:polysaccharide deacetylase family protein (PEP-CTERM system associated)
MSNLHNNITNYLTIDIEDYFHVSAFENNIKFDEWGNFESRIVDNTKKILELLSEVDEIKGTFFVLGWVAEKHPDIVKEIDANGHEIACHSYRHRLVYNMTPDEFRSDLIKSKRILEDITGKKVIGYRAPSYSITKKSLWAFEILEDIGFEYDSSVFPIFHDSYGIPNAPRFKYKLPGNNLEEFSISTANFFGLKVPVSGGGYFRLFPYWFTKMALRRINIKENHPFVFYIHPWELDSEQPRVNGANIFSRFRHYNNLRKTEERFKRLLNDFKFRPITTRDK